MTTEPSQARYSLVVPIYRNEANISELIGAIEQLAVKFEGFEAVFVVDGSPDQSGHLLLEAQPRMLFSSQVAFHSRNFGSFTAIRTGLEIAKGQYIAVMAADLQEPPELIEEFFRVLESDTADVVFGQRAGRADSLVRDTMSNVFWSVYRRLVIKDIPKGGVDIFACNRAVAETVLQIEEPNGSLVAQLFWIGYRRKFVPYVRRERTKGTSAWTFSKRFRYMMDSVLSFSDLPILVVLWVGLLGFCVSALFGIFVAIARLMDLITEPGYAALVVVFTMSFSVLLLVQGILGSYLWRTFENTKRRPLRIISRIANRQIPNPTADRE
jgi:glycosyltransferase involved in cell wall biosynthesis